VALSDPRCICRQIVGAFGSVKVTEIFPGENFMAKPSKKPAKKAKNAKKSAKTTKKREKAAAATAA